VVALLHHVDHQLDHVFLGRAGNGGQFDVG
jgi:hypothetical protein